MPQPRRRNSQAANRVFVDRETPQRVFEDAAFSIPADRSIVRVFYGVGGQGKTALCRELMRKTDGAREPAYAFLRRAELDLHGRPKDDPDRLLVWIRNAFAETGIGFPCFDLAFALAWDATRGEEPLPNFTKPWLKRATTLSQYGLEGAADAAKQVATELVGGVPGIGFALKKLGTWSIEKGKRAWLERTHEPLKALYDGEQLKKPYELSELLPWMLAQDLNAHLTDNPEERFVLFIDEYERVADEGGASARWEDNPFDRHMRRLVAETNGMLAVFFSREKLPWESDPDWRDDLRDNQHLLGGLAASDADRFLAAVPIGDAALRRAIIDGARETASPRAPVYPLMLDLQVAHHSALLDKGIAPSAEQFGVAAESFEGRRLEIVRRLLRDYGTPLQLTLEKLSVARRFDRAAFEHVVRTFGTGLPLDQFDRIDDLSFVSRLDDGYLSLHNLVAETIRSTLEPDARLRASAAMLEHFLARSQARTPAEVTHAHVLALYEAAWIRLQQGIDGYIDWLADNALKIAQSRFEREIAELWREAVDVTELRLGAAHDDALGALNSYAILMKQSGNYARARPLYERLLKLCETERGPGHSDTAVVRNNFAVFLRETGDYPAAIRLFSQALETSLASRGEKHPGSATMMMNLAELHGRLGEHDKARPLFERALAIREEILDPDDPDIATICNCMGSHLWRTGNHAGARAMFDRALSLRERVLGRDHPQTGSTLNDMALMLQDLGELDVARDHFERSVAISEANQGPDHADLAASLNNLGGVLIDLGDIGAAEDALQRSLAIYAKVGTADHPAANRARRNMARVHLASGRAQSAHALAEAALEAHAKVLGAKHETAAESAKVLADALGALGRLADAVAVRERHGVAAG
ncbi:MAG: tetratricopeptide repeat protein [Rhizobiaceae bacterium]|nr:tetratricopeptide repeat protein [Rhizobiaceae bacterium]